MKQTKDFGTASIDKVARSLTKKGYKSLAKIIKPPKCKCGVRLAMRNGLPINRLCPACRKAKKTEKIEKHKTTKKGQSEECKKLMRENDRLYQEVGRLTYNKCFFEGCNEPYCCLHHFVRKSQSLNTRYDFANGINICNKHHCAIHQGENSELEGKLVIIRGQEWFNELMKRKHITIHNKLEFLRSENIKLKLLKTQAYQAPVIVWTN